MVNIFSFFTGKKKSKRSASWTDAPTSSTAAQLVGSSTGTSTPAQESVKRQTSRYLSLRTRSSSKMIDSPKSLHRQSSIGSLRRKASRRSSITTVLPKFGFERDGEGKESLGKELGVSGSTLGLENLVGLPKLRDSEVDVIYAVELSVGEVIACWDLFGKALRDTGCDTVGLMLPQHSDPDPSTVHQLLALFLLHHQPSIAPSFPSISAYAASQTPKPLYSDLLRNALNDRPHPHELCEILKFSLQHLTPSQTPLIDQEGYIKFVQAEHAATYPLDAYSKIYLPRLGAGIGECLNSIFEVIADIAIKSEDNMMSGGKVCFLLGWWLCGHRKVEGDWQKVYKEWQVAGQRVEHLCYAWIRSQSTKSKLPTRLMELVEDYPFGESTLSKDHLPLPPASSFPRHTLHVHLESETKLSQLSPRDLLEAALRASRSSAPLLGKLQSLASEGEEMNIDHIIQLESQAFLKRSSGPLSQANTTTFRAAPPMSRLTIPASSSSRSMDSLAPPQLTPLLELSEELGTLASRHPSSKPFQRSTSSSSTSAPKADWDDFSKLGFGDAPETATKLDLQLSPRDLPLPLSRTPSAVEPIVPDRPSLKLTATREERIEIIDAFLPFVEDSQLDKINLTFNNILLVRLSTTAALELSEESSIEWLLLSVTYKPPTPLKPLVSTTLRSTSPIKESTTPRKRFSLGGLTSTFRRSSSMALRPEELKRSAGSKTAGRGSLEPLEEGGGDPTKVIGVGEMGELLEPVKIDSPAAKIVDREKSVAPSGVVAITSKAAMSETPQSEVQKEIMVGGAGEHSTLDDMTKALPTTTADLPAHVPVLAPSITGVETQEAALLAEPTAANNPDQSKSTDTQPISTSIWSSNIADWHYIAEGGANLVFGYHGRNPEFRNKVLRIPKSPETKPDDEVSDISILWRDELLPKLISKNHLPDVKPVTLDGKWVAGLVELVEDTRPDFRASIDLSAFSTSAISVKATLMDDLRASSSDVSHTVLAIEIKPKWGFLPPSEHIHPQEAASIKSEHSRYKLHQHMRGIETEYDPLDLYSGDMSRMDTAMQALWALWSSSGGDSNNWRVFVDGQVIGVHEGYMVPGVGESDDEATKTTPILSPVLWHSGVMQRLRDLQSTLDGTDISHLAQRFAAEYPESDLFDPTLLPQPSAEELRQFIELYLSDPHAGKSDKWSLRESLIAYAFSATFKDCSVFITCPLVSTSDGWKLDEPQATVKVIDLDLKPLANMRKWYDLDEKIWRHWQNTKSVAPEADLQPEHQLATPAQITRSAMPSRLASSSTEALYMPTPDRQENNPMDYPGTTPSFQSGLTAGQDTSSTRALHSKTPEDSQPSTPKALTTSTSETPASMSLSDALFISPSAATPASMSLSDALFISPSAAVTNIEQVTPASMSFSDALFISPSAAMTIANENGRRGSSFGLEESPMEVLNSHGHDEGLERHDEGVDSDGHAEGMVGREEKEEVAGGLRPETPERTTRSPGPSPSPGLADAASGLAAGNERGVASDLTNDNHQAPADDFTFPPKSTPIESEPTIANGNNDTTSGTNSTNAPDLGSSPPLNTSVVTHQITDEQASEPEQTVSDGDLPPPPSEADQQHVRSIISGITEEPIKSEIETAESEVTKLEDLPPASSAEDQQHFRSIIAGVTEEPIRSETEITKPEVLEQKVTGREVTKQEGTKQEGTEQESTKPELLPLVESAEDQQNSGSIDAGATEESTRSKVDTAEQDVDKPDHLPPVPSAEDQQHSRSIIADIADEPIKPEAETLHQETREPESEIADHHPIKSDLQAADDEPTTVPAVVQQQTSTSEVAPPVEEVQSEMPGSHLEEDRSTTSPPLADRQQHVRAILAGVVDDETTEPKSTEMDATVPSTDSEEPSLTPPFVTPMTFMDDVEPTYPELNETIPSTPTPKVTANESKPLDAQDSTSP